MTISEKDYQRYTGKDTPQANPVPVDLDKSPFIDPETHRVFLPSLITSDQERNFQIKRDMFLNGYLSLDQSVAQIRQYSIDDQYNNVFVTLKDDDKYWLKFIAHFKSVQQMQLLRQAEMFPKWLDVKGLRYSLKILIDDGLIMRWRYHHPIKDEDINVYTATGNGYRFVRKFYNAHLFNPEQFYFLDDRFHLRFWEIVDVYQILTSLPSYFDSSSWYKGKPQKDKPLLPSPLQVSLKWKTDQDDKPVYYNLVFYATLQNDNRRYYRNAINKWDDLTKSGQEVNFQINDLPVGTNFLTFYTPTLSVAKKISAESHLGTLNYPVLFFVGEEILNQGIEKAFFMPDSNDENSTPRRVDFNNIVKKS